MGKALHGSRFVKKGSLRKTRCAPAFALVEVTMSLSLLSLLGVTLLSLSLNVLRPRQWTVNQSLAEAYLTYERAYAQRLPFEIITAAPGSTTPSPWPLYPATSTVNNVEIGRLPGNRIVTGTVTRTRMADALNYPIDGGTGTTTTNPGAMKTWRLQSVLTYRIGERQYVKSRTVIRTQ